MILITGHRGFVGQHLTKELDRLGAKWRGYDLVEGDDIRDAFKLHTLFSQNKFHTVIHLAARAGVRTSELYPDEYFSTNVIGTQRLLENVKMFGVKHFILFSSSSVYGTQAPPNTEAQPCAPDSIYGITKATCEMLVRSSGVGSTIIRPFTIYGENGRADQLFYKWLQCHRNNTPAPFYGDGTTKRGYTYVGDLIRGLWAVMKKWEYVVDVSQRPWQCEIFNLGGSEVISLNDVRSIFAGELPDFDFQRLALPKGDVPENWGDITKARAILGFNPQTDFRKKVSEIIKTYTADYYKKI